jgi:hypothetical protein
MRYSSAHLPVLKLRYLKLRITSGYSYDENRHKKVDLSLHNAFLNIYLRLPHHHKHCAHAHLINAALAKKCIKRTKR